MLEKFCLPGKMSFVLGGQYGSEGKGSTCAWLTKALAEQGKHFDIVTVNNGCQSGHTSIHDGVKRVLFHLPTVGVLSKSRPLLVYLNAGSVIDPKVLREELEVNWPSGMSGFLIHPNAAVVTDECRDAEMRVDSAQTKIASTRKGVGEAISRKVLRSGLIARDHPWLRQFVRKIDLNARLAAGASVLCEIPQGVSLSLNSKFYPHTTSRDCTVMQAMSDAGVHPSFMGQTMLVMRTFPIRVGNIDIQAEYKKVGINVNDLNPDGSDFHLMNAIDKQHGQSGSCYGDQEETSWEALGVKAEITTVTKRVRRVFTWSHQQLLDAMMLCRPEIVYLTFCDYLKPNTMRANEFKLSINMAADQLRLPRPKILYQHGPSTADVKDWDPAP